MSGFTVSRETKLQEIPFSWPREDIVWDTSRELKPRRGTTHPIIDPDIQKATSESSTKRLSIKYSILQLPHEFKVICWCISLLFGYVGARWSRAAELQKGKDDAEHSFRFLFKSFAWSKRARLTFNRSIFISTHQVNTQTNSFPENVFNTTCTVSKTARLSGFQLRSFYPDRLNSALSYPKVI